MIEPCIIAGLMAEGWTEPAARRHVSEFFRRRSPAPAAIEATGGRGGNLVAPGTDLHSQGGSVLHGNTMERKHEPSPEKLFDENGKTRDDHVPGHDC